MSYKYVFVVEARISLGIEIEADDLDEAVRKAKAADIMGLCHQCSKSEPGVWSTSELDCQSPDECTLVDFHYGDPTSHFDKAAERWST